MLFSLKAQLHISNLFTKMHTPQRLTDQLLQYYIQQIKERKIKFIELEKKLPISITNHITSLLRRDAIKKYKETQFEEFKTELLVYTAENVEIHEDMRLVHDIDGVDREYVRDISIKFKDARKMYAVVEDPHPDFLMDQDNIIMMSDKKEELEKAFNLNHDDDLFLVEMYVDYYHTINEYEHPSWERIFKYVEKKCEFYKDTEFESEEPYEDRFGDY